MIKISKPEGLLHLAGSPNPGYLHQTGNFYEIAVALQE
jgi:hypothetical protein